jgi:hypothetical protein
LAVCWLQLSKYSYQKYSNSIIVFVSFTLFDRSLQTLKDDIKAGRKPMNGVNLGRWLVGEYWMTSTSPAWSGVPANIGNQGEFKAMQSLGTVNHFFFFLYFFTQYIYL